MRLRHFATCTLIVGLLSGAACTVDRDVVLAIGSTRLYVADGGLLTQAISTMPNDATIQVAEVTIDRADLTLGPRTVDLRFGESCKYVDTALVLPVGVGKCASGIVVDADDELRPASLALRFTMTVRRLQPLDLPVGADYDGDGVPNESDNCPLVDNPDQIDSARLGFGDACAILDITGGATKDSDADGIADSVDNCPQIPNPGQADAGIDVDGDGVADIPDAIGDACTEQTADVSVAGNTTIEVSLGPKDLLQPLNQATFLTVDLNDRESLTCNWAMEMCELDPTQIRFCIQNGRFNNCP